MSFIFLSVLVLCLDTLPELRGASYDGRNSSIVMCSQKNSSNSKMLSLCQMNAALLCVEIITTLMLTIEMALRQCLAPPGFGFRSSKYNFLMLLAVMPAWLVIIMEICHRHLHLTFSSSVDTIFTILYDMRVIRVFLVAKLGEYHQGLFVLLLSLRASIKEFSLVLILLFIFVIVYGNLIFFLEMRHEKIRTVAHGFWWALITMTTVGYGDTYPVSVGGYLVGCACAITGILVVALPIPVISQNFSACYRCIRAVNRKISRQRHKHASLQAKNPDAQQVTWNDGYSWQFFLIFSYYYIVGKQSKDCQRNVLYVTTRFKMTDYSFDEDCSQWLYHTDGNVCKFMAYSKLKKIVITSKWRCELTPYSQRAHLNISLWGVTVRSQWANTLSSQETNSQWAHCYHCMVSSSGWSHK